MIGCGFCCSLLCCKRTEGLGSSVRESWLAQVAGHFLIISAFRLFVESAKPLYCLLSVMTENLKNYQTPEVKSVCFVPRRPTGSIISATHCYSFKMVQEPQSTATADCSSRFFSVLFLLISVTFEAVKIDDPRTQPCSAFSDLKKHVCMHIVTVVWFTDDLKRKLRQALPLNHMEDFKVISSEDLVILRQSRVPWKLKELFQPGSLLSPECPWQSSDVSNGSQWRSVSEQLWKRASKKMENTVA